MLLIQCKVHGLPAPCDLDPLLNTITCQLPSLTPQQEQSHGNPIEAVGKRPRALIAAHGTADIPSHGLGSKQKGVPQQYLARVPGLRSAGSRSMQKRGGHALLFAKALSSLIQIMSFAEVPPHEALLSFVDTHINRNTDLTTEQLKLFVRAVQEFPEQIQVCCTQRSCQFHYPRKRSSRSKVAVCRLLRHKYSLCWECFTRP